MFLLAGKMFRLLRVGLVRAGMPEEVRHLPGNKDMTCSIVMDANTKKFGCVQATGYYPEVVVVAGGIRRQRLLDAGFVRSWAYVNAAREINADDEISSNELMAKLDNLLQDKILGSNRQPIGNAWPNIIEIYPFENYMIFQLKGQKYRQSFSLDPVERRVGLLGGTVPVKEMYVTAGDAKESMPRSQTGHHYNYAHTRGQLQTIAPGGKTSELVTQLVRNWGNVLEAVRMYLDYAKARTNKQQMRPAFQPVDVEGTHKIEAMLRAHGIDRFDFACWSAAVRHKAITKKTKSHGGEEVPMSKHAYVGDPKDPSTWHLPLDKPGRIRDALARVNQTKGIPQSAKPRVLHKIRRAAEKHGIGVSSKPTPKQKAWTHRGKALGSTTKAQTSMPSSYPMPESMQGPKFAP
ncbi:MAG: hypothetical protein KGL39_22145 [Patescibacteria group bacterium]|nr:hypothetical protein [Patescibacteria group bacterium]